MLVLAAAAFYLVLPAACGALVALQRRFEGTLFVAVVVMVPGMLAYALLSAMDVGTANITAIVQLVVAVIGFLATRAVRGKRADSCESFRMPFANGDPV